LIRPSNRYFEQSIRVRAVGSWSPGAPPYLLGIAEKEFVRLKEEWLKRMMMIGALAPSRRVLAYFLADSLNWATMDSWLSHQTMGDLAGTSTKTVQRTVWLLEDKTLLAVYRRSGSSHPLRYAPVYLVKSATDNEVRESGQSAQPALDTGVHESFLQTRLKSEQDGLPKKESKRGSFKSSLSFNLAERGRIERDVAPLLGGIDVLCRLAAIHDDVITRICEAYVRGDLGERQIKAAKLAAKQTQAA
jgi:hypothetical protein